jgi:CheY-like chemotaxis protein
MNSKVLVIDDEADVVTYLVNILEDNGYTPYAAESAEKGMEMLGEIHPSLICLDIMMPKESGISMYSKLRRDPKYSDIPVLIISGFAAEKEFDFRELVPDTSVPAPQKYLEKPVDIKRFLESIRELIGSSSANQRTEVTPDG